MAACPAPYVVQGLALNLTWFRMGVNNRLVLNNTEAFVQLAIFLIMIILLSRLAILLSRWVHLPSISFQLLFGILIGPSLFNLLGVPIVIGTWGSISPSPLHSVLKILAEIGLIQLMFLAGLQTDWHRLKTDLKPIFSVGGWSFISAAIGIAVVVRCFVDRWPEALAVSATLAAPSVGISAYNFSETKLLQSRAAQIALGSAFFTVGLAILLMISSQALSYASAYGISRMIVAVSWFVGKLIMFFAIAYFLTSRFLKLIAEAASLKRPRQALIGYLLLVAALYGWAAVHFGSFAAVGVASMGGALLVRVNLEWREKIRKGSESLLGSLPLGILFIVLGMGINLREPGGSPPLWVLLIATAILTRMMGCWIAVRNVLDSTGERVLITFASLPHGEMGVLIASHLFSRGLVSPQNFNNALIVVILSVMVTPLLMRLTRRVVVPER
jgi:Kef-type K+ transport system membrane component KefB